MILVLQYARDGVWPILSSWWQALTGKYERRRIEPQPQAPDLPQRPRPTKGSLVMEVDSIRKEFGGLVEGNGISFWLKAGEIMGLFGANGAGSGRSAGRER